METFFWIMFWPEKPFWKSSDKKLLPIEEILLPLKEKWQHTNATIVGWRSMPAVPNAINLW